MSPGKFSRKPTTPNKPPVCHKGPIAPVPLGLKPWDRPANLFYVWTGSLNTGYAERSWAVQMKADPHLRTQQAAETAGDISFYLNMYFDLYTKTWGYITAVTHPHNPYFWQMSSGLPLLEPKPSFTGRILFLPSFFTASGYFEVLP